MAIKKTAKTTNSKTTKNAKTAKTKKREFVKFEDFLDSSANVEEGQIWLKSGRYVSCCVSIALDESSTISDWARCIELRNVNISVEENEVGYATLVISGNEDEDDDEDAEG